MSHRIRENGVMFALVVSLVLPAVSIENGFDLTPHAERTDWRETGTLDEIAMVCERLKGAGQGCDVVGTSAGGRPIHAFTLSSIPVHRRGGDPAFAARPVLLVLGGIHAGEIDGKDASLLLIEELLGGPPTQAQKPGDRDLLRGVLDVVTVVFVPVYNVDGFARFKENNRPNQRGPKKTGWRVNDQNLNLNRDWTKAVAPETRALTALMNRLDPVVVVDLHVTDGAQFQHDIAVVVEPFADDGSVGPLMPARAALSTALSAHLSATGHLPLSFYPAFEVDDDPASGIAVGVTPARFTHGYAARRGRLGILVETHAWRTYKERVFATADTLRGLLSLAKTSASSWQQAARQTDALQARLPGRDVVVAWDTDLDKKETFPFQGYAYTREPSAISGALWTRYDETKKQVWQVPLWTTAKATSTTKAPRAYAVRPAFAALVRERLVAHGLSFTTLERDATVPAEVFRASSTTFGVKPYEGQQTVKVQGAWTPTTTTLTKGTLIVPVGQVRGRLVVELFEPAAAESLVGWGFFNAVFEQKEYMEAYVAEAEARAMLAADARLRAAFEERLEADPAFAQSPEARLDFFYQRHPSWDENKDLLPVVRLSMLP